MKKNLQNAPDTLWRQLFQLAGFLGDRGIQRQNRDAKKLISGLTVRQQQILREVYKLTQDQPEGVPLKTLAGRLELSPGTTSESVETLVRKMALEREICSTDRRSVRIRVSRQGMDMFRLGIDQYQKDSRTLLSALDDKETSALLEMLGRMLEKAAQSDQDRPENQKNLQR